MRSRNRRFNESYSDINSSNAWDAYYTAIEYLGADGLCEALAKAMGTDELASNLEYIFRMYEIPFGDDEFDESIKRNRSIKEGRTMPYVLWVLNGDTRQWEMYKGVNDAKQFIRDNDYDEFLDELNTQVFPNETYYNNYIDWIVIPAGEEPRKFDTHKFYNSLKYESIRSRHKGLR